MVKELYSRRQRNLVLAYIRHNALHNHSKMSRVLNQLLVNLLATRMAKVIRKSCMLHLYSSSKFNHSCKNVQENFKNVKKFKNVTRINKMLSYRRETALQGAL